jgi:hypothetical protein
MATVTDDNDLIYTAYSLDFLGIARSLYDWLTDVDTGALAFFWNIYSLIALLLSLLFITGFIYAKIRYAQLVEIEDQQLLNAEEAWTHAYLGASTRDTRWSEIEQHITSDNPNDWRLAIIEADILFEETLTNAGYVGVSVGDKLKTANTTSFQTLQDAWDAHKVRNQIAHIGDFVLTKRVAEEAIVKYERVFREFGAI